MVLHVRASRIMRPTGLPRFLARLGNGGYPITVRSKCGDGRFGPARQGKRSSTGPHNSVGAPLLVLLGVSKDSPSTRTEVARLWIICWPLCRPSNGKCRCPWCSPPSTTFTDQHVEVGQLQEVLNLRMSAFRPIPGHYPVWSDRVRVSNSLSFASPASSIGNCTISASCRIASRAGSVIGMLVKSSQSHSPLRPSMKSSK